MHYEARIAHLVVTILVDRAELPTNSLLRGSLLDFHFYSSLNARMKLSSRSQHLSRLEQPPNTCTRGTAANLYPAMVQAAANRWRDGVG